MVECPRAQNPGRCGTRAKQRCCKAAARQRGVGLCEPVARLLRRSEAGLARAGDRAAAQACNGDLPFSATPLA